MNKHHLWFVLAATLLSACKEEKTEPPPPAVKVGVSISSIATNPFFQGAYEAYKSNAQDLGMDLFLDAADNDQDKQNQQLEAMIQQGAQVLIVNLAQVKYGRTMLNHFCQRNIPVVYFNRSPGEANLAGCKSAYFVDGDAILGGRLQGEQVLKKWRAHPQWDKNNDGIIQYAMLQGLEGHEGAELRTKWAIAAIEHHADHKISTEKIFQDFANFQTAKAEEVMNQWTASPDFAKVEVIFANNDTMALGAVNVLKNKGLNVPVFGIDASQSALKAVVNGDMQGTVFNDFNMQARVSLQVAQNIALNRAPNHGLKFEMSNKIVQIPYRDVNETNIQQYMK